MTQYEAYDLYGGSNLRRRTTVNVGAAAFGILTEDPGTVNHASRLAWAKVTLPNVPIVAESFLWGVIGSPTVIQLGEAVSEGDLAYIVNQLVNIFAGV